jgi:hypothetical protein
MDACLKLFKVVSGIGVLARLQDELKDLSSGERLTTQKQFRATIQQQRSSFFEF